MRLFLTQHVEVIKLDYGHYEPHAQAFLYYNYIIRYALSQYKVRLRDFPNSDYWAYTGLSHKNNRKTKHNNLKNSNQLVCNYIPY